MAQPQKVQGFTIAELMIAATLMIFALVALLHLFTTATVSGRLDRNANSVMNELQDRMERVRNVNFSCLSASPSFCTAASPCSCPTVTANTTICPSDCPTCFCNNCTYDLTGFSAGTAKARIEITNETIASQNTTMRRIRVAASYRVGNVTFGEDVNFDGFLAAGEDADGDSQLDTPAELVTYISK